MNLKDRAVRSALGENFDEIVNRTVAEIKPDVDRLRAERDAARSLAASLEQECAVRDEALAELRALHVDAGGVCDVCCDDWGAKDWPCPTVRVLDALAARLSAHLFPTDEEGASDE